ncbi:MAG: hypothetical protein K2X86_08650 [Cytophagaceae bacterium]|nr:hypothetical protein [Cytophagaceae bacterium]
MREPCSSIKWFGYLLNNKKLEVGKVLLDNPSFLINTKAHPGKSIRETDRNFLELLPGIIAAFTGSLRIEGILIRNGSLQYDVQGRQGITHQLADSIWVDLQKIVIDTISTKKTLYSDKAFISLSNYILKNPGNLNNLSIGRVYGAVHDSILNAQDIYFHKQDSANAKFKDELILSLDKIQTRGVDYSRFLKDKKIAIRTMILYQPDVKMKSSDSPVTRQEVKNEQQPSILDQVIPYISGSFRMDTLAIKNGKINYKIENSGKSIMQSADHINLQFSRVLIDTLKKNHEVFAEDMSLQLSNYNLTKKDVSELNIASLSASLKDSSLLIKRINFKNSKGNTYSFSAERIFGNGIDYMKMLTEDAAFNALKITRPSITIKAREENNKTTKHFDNPQVFFRSVFGPLADASLKIKKFIIENGDINYSIKSDSGFIEQNANDLFVRINEVKIDSVSAMDYDFYKSFVLSGNNYQVKVHQENFVVKVTDFSMNSEKSQILLNKLSISQIRSFGELQRYYFINTIESAVLENFQFDKLISESKIHSGSLDINKMNLRILLDDGKPNIPDYLHYMPNELMQKLHVYLRMDSVKLNDAYIGYEAHDPEYKEAGKLSFEKLNLTAYNIANDTILMTDFTPAIARGSMYIMGEGLMDFYIESPLMSKKFNVRFGGTIDSMEGRYFNSLLAFGGIRLESGELLPSTFDVTVKNGSANGQMQFVYKDLHVKILDDNEEPKKFASVLGNFAIKNHNPNDKDEEPETVFLCARRTDEDGFFNFIWRTLKGGIVETVTKSTVYSVKK